jgi:hypothetical protein
MESPRESVCAICLEPCMSTHTLRLGCGHEYHAGCLLLSFRKLPVKEWRCPLCRDRLVKRCTKGKNCSISMWESMNVMVGNAGQKLHMELSEGAEAPYYYLCRSIGSVSNNSNNDNMEYPLVPWRDPLWARSTLLNKVFEFSEPMDEFCATIVAKQHLNYLLDPSKTSVSAMILHHMLSLLGSCAVFVLCIAIVFLANAWSSLWICPISKIFLEHLVSSSLVSAHAYESNQNQDVVAGFSQIQCLAKSRASSIYLQPVCFGLIACVLMLQAKRMFRLSSRSLVHDWPVIGPRINVYLILFAVIYSLAICSFRIIFVLRFMLSIMSACISMPYGNRIFCFDS